MADVNSAEIVDSGVADEGHLTTKDKSAAHCTPCGLGDGQTGESEENGSCDKKDPEPAKDDAKEATTADDEATPTSGVKRKSEHIDSIDDPKKVKTGEEKDEVKNGAGHGDKKDDTHDKAADDVQPEIVNKTVEDVANLCGDVDAASS